MRKDDLNMPQKDLEMAQAMQDKIDFDSASVAVLQFGASLNMSGAAGEGADWGVDDAGPFYDEGNSTGAGGADANGETRGTER
jgi:hypothetical protein